MTTATTTPYRSEVRPGRDGFAQLLHAEWTKFRTVRGWVIGMLVAVLVSVLVPLLDHSSCSPVEVCSAPVGPDGEAVTDNFYFVHQPLAGNGSITVRLTSLTGVYSDRGLRPGQDPQTYMKPGLEPWSKAGIIIKENTQRGSAYAAMMVTGSHGVRMQHNYTHDAAGLAGGVSAASPNWLRLTRSGDTLTGYDSTDGSHWTEVGTATLPGLPSTVQAGLFAASPGHAQLMSQSLVGGTTTGGPTQATGTFDHVSLQGTWPGSAWTGEDIGANGAASTGLGGFHQARDGFDVAGSGDIAPDVPSAAASVGTPIERTLVGGFAGLIVVIVVATMFITAEYRRGLIRTTLAASPRRARVLVAKAIVIGTVTFVAGLVGAGAAVPIGKRLLRDGGNFMMPVTTLTELRVVAGTAALFAVAAVLALALGALLRRSAGAVTAVIVAIVLPYILATSSVLPTGPSEWLLRVTPAAAFAIQQSISPYPQVTASYTPSHGYFPLAPWAGFAVLCGYAVLALGLAVLLLRRRDA